MFNKLTNIFSPPRNIVQPRLPKISAGCDPDLNILHYRLRIGEGTVLRRTFLTYIPHMSKNLLTFLGSWMFAMLSFLFSDSSNRFVRRTVFTFFWKHLQPEPLRAILPRGTKIDTRFESLESEKIGSLQVHTDGLVAALFRKPRHYKQATSARSMHRSFCRTTKLSLSGYLWKEMVSPNWRA